MSKQEAADTKQWQRPELRSIGTLGEVVKGGGAKLSIPSDGDGRKGLGLG